MIRFSEAAWTAILAADTAAGRAQALATLNPTTIEFLDAEGSVIRTVTTGNWTVSGANAIPGTYTDAGTGAGTPAAAVFKTSGTEVMRMSCGTLAGSDYLLLANIVASVKIRRSSFAVTFLDPPGAGASEPAATVAPVISGTAQVGQTLTATAGTWTGNPAPTITRQWYRGASAISGATGSFYTLVEADAGAVISLVETGTNSVGSATSTSNTLGPVADGPLDASAVPSPINLDQGGTFDFTPYISGGVPPYTVAVASGSSLPAEVTLTNNVLTASGSATVALSGDIVFDVDDSAVAATLPTFGVLSSVGGADLPFTFGHVFAQGDVPSGSYVDSDLTDWQCVPTTTWPDGSLRHAIISGRATCTQNVRKDITLSVSGTDRTGTALTETDLAAALPTVTIQGGSHTTTLNSLVGTANKHRTVCTGPIMSNWIYRHAPVGTSNHLVIWIDVRLYKGGRVEIFPWVENAYLTVAGPTNDVRTWTVTIGGTQVFSQSIDIKHHTRIPLISGSSFSYWTTDPGIVPIHDAAYMMTSRMVPNYGWTGPSEATLAAMAQTYTPNSIGDMSAAMGAAGYAAHIGLLPNWCALHLTSDGDTRAYRNVVANGLAAGSWYTHFRDEATNEVPLLADHPTLRIDSSNGSLYAPDSITATGGVNSKSGVSVSWAGSHVPVLAYYPWLLTGRYWFKEEQAFWSVFNMLRMNPLDRGNAEGRFFCSNVSSASRIVRETAWGLRELAVTAAIYGDDGGIGSAFVGHWQYNMAEYAAAFITGTKYSGGWVNDLGVIGLGSSNGNSQYGGTSTWTDAPWMQTFFIASVGFAWDLGIDQSAQSLSDHQALRDFGYKGIVGQCGGSGATEFCYRRFMPYSQPYGTDGLGVPPETWYADWGEAYDALEAQEGYSPLADKSDGLTLLRGAATPVSVEDWSTGYPGNGLPALAYAKEHGATGADAAWTRITGSASWSLTDSAFPNTPVWGVKPRNV